MPDKPVVTVIMTFLNSQKYIAQAIESVISQTFNEWELLLVDDGSFDSSSLIAKEYAVKFPDRIFYLDHPDHRNLGKSSSRNLGIIKARGSYVTFLDSDDIFLPHKIQHQLELLNINPEASMVFGVTEYWYSWDPNSKKKDFTPLLGLKALSIFRPPELAVFFMEHTYYTPCICSLLVRRDLLLYINAFDETIQDLFEDQVLIYKICLNARVITDNWCNEKYRQHAESTSSRAMLNHDYHPVLPSSSRLNFLKWFENYINMNSIDSPRLHYLVQKELRIFEYPAFYSVYLPAKNILRKIGMRMRILLKND